MYGRGGYPVYWVVHRNGIEVFSAPFEAGYRQWVSIPADGRVPVAYGPEVELSVATLLDAED